MGGSEVEATVADAETTPSSHARPTPPWARRLAWPVLFVAAGLALFAAYLRQAQTVPVNSDGGSFALQAMSSSMSLHSGNFDAPIQRGKVAIGERHWL